jgi:hypothetical protein
MLYKKKKTGKNRHEKQKGKSKNLKIGKRGIDEIKFYFYFIICIFFFATFVRRLRKR